MQTSLHKQKIYALLIAAVCFIAMLLPWITVQGTALRDGFSNWGFLSLTGIGAVLVATLMDEKTKVYQGNFKFIAIGGFFAVWLGGFITMLTKNSVSGGYYQGYGMANVVGTGYGAWLIMLAAATGTALASGQLKIPENKKPPEPPTS